VKGAVEVTARLCPVELTFLLNSFHETFFMLAINVADCVRCKSFLSEQCQWKHAVITKA